jgi:hypothetical protein
MPNLAGQPRPHHRSSSANEGWGGDKLKLFAQNGTLNTLTTEIIRPIYLRIAIADLCHGCWDCDEGMDGLRVRVAFRRAKPEKTCSIDKFGAFLSLIKKGRPMAAEVMPVQRILQATLDQRTARILCLRAPSWTPSRSLRMLQALLENFLLTVT